MLWEAQFEVNSLVSKVLPKGLEVKSWGPEV